jgi:hypothetical protein
MSNLNVPRWLILLGLLIFLTCPAHAQINFVQITDPHIFDDVNEEDGSRLNDKAALASFVEKINQRVAEMNAEKTGPYSFVVVTGDLGLEQLLKGIEENERRNKLRSAAVELASIIGLSKVETWLFVPGNNDLLDEVPGNIKYYHAFIEELTEAVKGAENKITIVDLCAQKDPATAKKPFFQSGGFAFIGFNDASFKNSDDTSNASTSVGRAMRIDENFNVQLSSVADVSRQLEDKDITHAYIFYHIPEIDDPYFVTLKDEDAPIKTRYTNRNATGGPYLYSSWFVKSEVREKWNNIVLNPKVKGLFAGHFHDNKRSTYESLAWLRTDHYVSGTLEKLHVCPPLALKKQKGKEEQARGFQEVYLDQDGNVSTRIFWFGQGGWNLNTALATAETTALKQLELGRTYEELDRLKEAEAAYVKAAESNWAATRQIAIESLKRVSQRQDALSARMAAPVVAAWGAGVTAVSTTLITGFLTLLLLAGFWGLSRWGSPYCNRYWKRKGRNKVKLGPITASPKNSVGPRFEQILLIVHRRLRTHFNPRKLIQGVPRLPMIAKTQSAEVTEIVESLIPGGMGKYVGWLLKESDKPQYSIEAVIQSSRWGHRLILVSLKDDGELLKDWHKRSSPETWIADEKKVAFDAMKRLVRYMHR